MPMTAHKFERINGHTPEIHQNGAAYWATCICDCGTATAELTSLRAASESDALKGLLQVVLAEHGAIALHRANWHCQQCDVAGLGLSAHHRKYRSHGRDDRVANLIALCPPCHQAIHDSGVRPADRSASAAPE